DYDGYGRPTRQIHSFDGLSFETKQEYDCRGAIRGIEYPNGEAVEFEYSPWGYLLREKNPLGRTKPLAGIDVYREILEMSPRQMVTLEKYGNDLYGHSRYYDSTGQLKSICVGVDEDCTGKLQWREYEYRDPYGNLTAQIKRTHGVPSVEIREEYEYDEL